MPETDREASASERRLFTLERLSALSDGVIAIALTLLVLEIKPPDIPGATPVALLTALEGMTHDFLVWAVSFLLIARFWQEHHLVWAHTRFSDMRVIVLTLVFLAGCSLIPFGADLAGDYPDDHVAVLVFSAILVGTAAAVALMGMHVAASDHLQGDRDCAALRRRAVYLLCAVPLLGAATWAGAYAHTPAVGIAVWFVEPLAVWAMARVIHKPAPKRGPALP